MISRVKRKSTIFIITALFILIAGGCSVKQESPNIPVPAVVPSPTAKGTDVNQYIIDAVLDTANKELTAEQQVIYVNNDDVELSELYFHIYANAFRKQETAPFLFDDFSMAYSRGFKPGYTEIEAIEFSKGQNRNALEYSLQGVGETILRIKLPEPLKPEGSVNLRFKYKVIIPPAGERFGYGDANINMGNWYPVAAVFDDEGWNLDKYYSIGDPFYSDVSDYIVSIKAPEEYIIAASGSLAEERIEGGYKNWKFHGANMRDFAFVASNNFRVAEDKVGNTVVKSYYYKDHEKRGKEALDIGKRSIEVFNSAYGEYPYPTYSIVETEFPSGMEYPGLVYISTKYYDNDSGADIFMYTTVHETAHQ
ncbi:MAG TPA: M1 family metallopeptidase, partial [Bacillota bacterium]|nr:M1 family metallopeptidase [Bacillota bacterium]